MPDAYPDFAALRAAEPRAAYAIVAEERGSSTAVVAPHGGGIEPGTSEIARAIAGSDLSYYLFEGCKPRGNRTLHITSSRFDEPVGLALMRAARIVLAVHGEAGEAPIVYLGGRRAGLVRLLRDALEGQGFPVSEHPDPRLSGLHPGNVCNIGREGEGVQLELSSGLRASLFESLSRDGRIRPTARFHAFCRTIGATLRDYTA